MEEQFLQQPLILLCTVIRGSLSVSHSCNNDYLSQGLFTLLLLDWTELVLSMSELQTASSVQFICSSMNWPLREPLHAKLGLWNVADDTAYILLCQCIIICIDYVADVFDTASEVGPIWNFWRFVV